MDEFCETVKLNALLHNHVSCVNANCVIYINAYPSDTYIGYSYDVKVVREEEAMLALNECISTKQRLDDVRTRITMKRKAKQGPVVILLCKHISKASKGKVKAINKDIVWVSSCTWMC